MRQATALTARQPDVEGCDDDDLDAGSISLDPFENYLVQFCWALPHPKTATSRFSD